MPKSRKKKTASKLQEWLDTEVWLELLNPARFRTRSAIREFVRSDTYEALAHAVTFTLVPVHPEPLDKQPRLTSAARSIAASIVHDLQELAQAAAVEGASAVIVTENHGNYKIAEALAGLAEFAHVVAASMDSEESVAAVLDVIAYVAGEVTVIEEKARAADAAARHARKAA